MIHVVVYSFVWRIFVIMNRDHLIQHTRIAFERFKLLSQEWNTKTINRGNACSTTVTIHESRHFRKLTTNTPWIYQNCIFTNLWIHQCLYCNLFISWYVSCYHFAWLIKFRILLPIFFSQVGVWPSSVHTSPTEVGLHKFKRIHLCS